jgi:hypothetical protein
MERKIRIYEVRQIIAEIERTGVSGQGEIALIKAVGHIGSVVNGLQWSLGTADAGTITKEFNKAYRLNTDGHVVEV